MKAFAVAAARKCSGVVLVLAGIVLLFLPGPGIVLIVAGATLLGYGPQTRALFQRWMRRARGRGEASPEAPRES